MMNTTFRASFLLAAAATLSACGGDTSTHESGSAFVPSEETFYLPTPEDVSVSSSGLTATGAEGLCASDSRALARAEELIAEHNQAIQDQIALFKALKRAARLELVRTGVYSKTVTNGDRSLTFTATLNTDRSVSYEATFTGPNVQSFRVLAGTTAADQQSGSWSFYRPNGGEVVHVTWQRGSGSDLTVTRTLVESGATATYQRTGDDASITITNPNRTVEIAWSVSTKAGSLTVSGEARLCWNDQLCTIACPE